MPEATYTEPELKEANEMANGRSQPTSELDIFFELSQDMLCVAGTDGYFKRVSLAFEKVLGWTSGELLAQPYFDFVHPDDVITTQNEIGKLAQGVITTHFEHRFRCQNGSYKWLAWSARPMPDGTLYAVAHDITHQKQVEKALHESQDRYLSIIEAIEDGYYEVDLNGQFTFFNRSLSHILGYPANELLGKSYQAYTDSETSEEIRAVFNKVYTTGEPARSFIWQFHRQDGSTGYVETSISPIKNTDGEITGFRGIGRDVTNVKQIEQIFEQTERTYRKTAVGASSFVYQFLLTADNKATFPYISEAAENLLQVSAEALQKDASQLINFVQLEHANKLRQQLDHSARTLQAFQWQGLFNLPSGVQKWFQTTSYPERLSNGDTLWYGFWTDITEQRQAEIALQESQSWYQQILDAIPDMILVKREKSHIVWANKAFREYYAMSNEELDSLIDAPFNEPDYTQQYIKDDLHVFTTGQVLDIPEEPVKRHDGVERLFHTIKSPIRDSQGNVVMTVGVSRDITEGKKSEFELKEAQARSEAILQSVTVPLLISRITDGMIAYANNHLASLIGLPLEDLLGKQTPDFYANPDERAVFLKTLREQGYITNYELLAKRANGELIWVLVSAQTLQFQGNISIIATFLDITRRKQSEEALAKQAAELETVAQISTAVASTLDTSKLLQNVVDLVKTNFNLYHAHIYLFNPEGNTLELATGAGTVGRQMAAEGRHIPLDQEQSLVARAAKTRQGVIVNNVFADSGFLPHPLLPDTRAELAVPLIMGDNVLGVLDVQADQIGRFSHQDINIQTTLAAQIAIALQNARQYQQVQQRNEEIQETFSLLDSIIENLPVGLFTKDAETLRFVRWNQANANLVGLNAEEVIGKNDYDLFPQEEADFFTTIDRQVLTSGEVLEIPEEEVKTAHQGFRTLHTRKLPIFDANGKPKYLLGISEDITERKRAEKLQTANMDRYRLILELSPDPVVLYDPTGKVNYVNAAFTQVFGWTQEELLGKQIDFVPEKSRSATAEAVRRLITEGFVQDFETERLTKDGRYLNVLTSGSVIRDEAGNLLESVVILRNITERKRAEEALAKQASDLETVAQISTAVTTTHNTQQLLQDVVDLTKFRFNLYHAHIYLLDEINHTLTLTAGAGDIGRSMVAEGRQIPLNQDQSLVAQAARTRQGVIVNDVQSNPNFLSHPLLPDTRSEMAVPLIVGNRILGVLDVQSDVIGRFNQQDINIQTTLASQIAVALENARTFEASEKAQQDLNALTRRLTREGWEGYLETSEQQGLQYSFTPGLSPDKEPETVETAVPSLLAPITVQGEQIGQMALIEPRRLTDDASDIIQAVAERLGAHIENLRLSEQTQRALAQTEALYQGSGRIAQAKTIQEVLHSLVFSTALQNLDRVNILLYNRPWTDTPADYGTIVAVWEQSGQPPRAPVGTVYQSAQFPSVQLFSPDNPIILYDTQSDKRLDENLRNLLARLGMRGLLVFPIVVAGDWIGFVSGQSQKPIEMTDEQIRQITGLTSQAATVIQNLRLFSQAQARAERERYVRTVTDKIRRGTSREAMLQVAVEELSHMLEASKSITQLGTPEQLLTRLSSAKESSKKSI